MDEIRPIITKGENINNIIFLSKKMTYDDIIMGLWFCRPLEEPATKSFLHKLLKDMDEFRYTGMNDKTLNDMLCEPIFGGDYICQLIFGCIAALEVYTEEEILKVLDAQKNYRSARNG